MVQFTTLANRGRIMISGPNLFYKCPNCKKTVRKGSLRSGNTFGSKLFSDGKRIAPMLPAFPFIVKCKKCNTFFWLNGKNQIGKYDLWKFLRIILCVILRRNYRFSETKNKWKDADRAEFLSPNEYYEAINLKIYKDKHEEQCLRLNLWQAFNDRIREGKDLFLTKDDEDIYESNCIALIEMLDKNEINQKIMIAELYRSLGKYVECNNILDTIEDGGLAWIKEALKKECEKNNKNVIELKLYKRKRTRFKRNNN